jgi:hypothetical protein
MKLSDTTLAVLKNFASINTGVVLQTGKRQKTISPDKSILVEAVIQDDITEVFGIYDLPQFLGNISALNNPDMTFTDKMVEMSDGQVKLSYFSCSPNLITVPPDKKLEMKNVDVGFTLTNAALQKLLMLSKMNSLPMLSVIGKSGKLSLRVHEDSDTSNAATIDIGNWDHEDFDAKFKTEHLKMIPDDYEVKIALKAFATFENKDGSLKYYIALQSK